MKIQITIEEAQLLLADKVGAPFIRDLALETTSNVTVEIAVPEQPQPWRHKIAAIKALREDYHARKEYLGLAEAKRLVELVYAVSGIPV